MDSPFSALVEWLTSPQVVGSFVIVGVGLVLSTILLALSYWACGLDSDVVCIVLGFFGVMALVVTVICLCCFNTWFVGVQ